MRHSSITISDDLFDFARALFNIIRKCHVDAWELPPNARRHKSAITDADAVVI
jgi:hypothetical protein